MSSSHDHIQGRKEEEGVVSSIKVSVFFFFLIRKQESFNQICLYVLLLDLNGDYKGNWESANLGKPNEMTVLALAQSGFTSWGYSKVWVCREEVGVMAVGEVLAVSTTVFLIPGVTVSLLAHVIGSTPGLCEET